MQMNVVSSEGDLVQEDRILARYYLGGEYLLVLLEDKGGVAFQIYRRSESGDQHAECMLAPIELTSLEPRRLAKALQEGQRLARKRLAETPPTVEAVEGLEPLFEAAGLLTLVPPFAGLEAKAEVVEVTREERVSEASRLLREAAAIFQSLL